MEPKVSLLCSRQSNIELHPQSAESGPHPQIVLFITILILSSHLRLHLVSGIFPSGLQIYILYAFLIQLLLLLLLL